METLKEMLIRHEGWRTKPYRDSNGFLTIGCGHNISANGLPEYIRRYLKENGSITNEMVNELLENDIKIAKDACLRLYPRFNSFTENRKNALIDFLFNVGIGTAKKFERTNQYINMGFWTQAANNLKKSLWYRQVKKRGIEIVDLISRG